MRALTLAVLCSAVVAAAPLQPADGVVHVKVVLADAQQTARPVPSYALLISANPPTAAPRRVVTGVDGTVSVHLHPGSYIVESDAPFVFEGKAYEWHEIVNLPAGRDVSLELTAANADVGPPGAASTSETAPAELSVSTLQAEWQDSVLALWTPTTHASGFVIDANGLIATDRRAIGAASSVEVQIAPAVKVAASVLASDPAIDVAVLWMNPSQASSLRPVPLGCSDTRTPLAKDQEIVTIGSPLREAKGPRFGTVNRVDSHSLATDLVIAGGSSGGPVFTSAGAVVGMTSVSDGEDQRRRGNARVIPVADVCKAVASAQASMKNAAPPSDARLPVEPSRPFPVEALKEMAKRRVGSLNPYQQSSTDFDIAFITPVMIYAEESRADEQARDRSASGRSSTAGPALLDFGNWSEYVVGTPPVLFVRVTPKMVEGFWTKVARGAAQTQGVALPAFKHIRSGFSGMRAYCGEAEIAPIHPFKIERHVSETETVYEGLGVFDPGALAPSCGSVKLVLYSEKEPQKGDARVIDTKIIDQIWQDFAPYRQQ